MSLEMCAEINIHLHFRMFKLIQLYSGYTGN